MEAFGCDNLQRLWEQIDQQFLLYLIADSWQMKFYERVKLNLFIREYLYMAPEDKKYMFPETAQIIRKSILTNPDFSPVKASDAWGAIGMYAINLVLEPWRKEYQELRLYCGYFKHQIHDCLVDSELMFELMGFCHVGNGIMSITDVLDPDKITNVSRDAFVAAVECQILREIYENVVPHFDFTWPEILDYRERHTGSSDQAIKTLKFQRRQLLYEKEGIVKTRKTVRRIPLATDSDMEYHNPVFYDDGSFPPSPSHVIPANVVLVAYPVQEQSRFCAGETQRQAPVGSAGETPESSQFLPPGDAEEVPDPGDSSDESEEVAQALQDLSWDHHDDSHPNNRSFDSDQSSFPTGQVIQLDSSQFQVHEPPREYQESDDEDDEDDDHHHDHDHDDNDDDDDDDDGGGGGGAGAAAAAAAPAVAVLERQEKSEDSSANAKAKQNGSTQWDDWTYLDNYMHKPAGENGTAKEGGNQNKLPDPEDQDESVIFKKVKIRSGKTGEQKPKRTEREGDEDLKREGSPVIKRDVSTSGSNRTAHKKRNDSEIEVYVEENPKSKRKSKLGDEANYDDDDDEDDDTFDAQWQCITCTFLNKKERSICEMCFKSKDPGNECRPRFKRGVICKKCTLINEEGNHFCDACGQRLTFAAIFI